MNSRQHEFLVYARNCTQTQLGWKIYLETFLWSFPTMLCGWMAHNTQIHALWKKKRSKLENLISYEFFFLNDASQKKSLSCSWISDVSWKFCVYSCNFLMAALRLRGAIFILVLCYCHSRRINKTQILRKIKKMKRLNSFSFLFPAITSRS